MLLCLTLAWFFPLHWSIEPKYYVFPQKNTSHPPSTTQAPNHPGCRVGWVRTMRIRADGVLSGRAFPVNRRL